MDQVIVNVRRPFFLVALGLIVFSSGAWASGPETPQKKAERPTQQRRTQPADTTAPDDAAAAKRKQLQKQLAEQRARQLLIQRQQGRQNIQILPGGRLQVGRVQTSIPGDDDLAATTFRPDREALRLLRKAVELRDQKRYSDAVQALGRILEADEDSFFPTSDDGRIHRSVKAEAQRMIGQLPKSGRDSYQLQYGAAAGQMLEEAVREGDVVKLGEVSRRFFHTAAGYQATHLLGVHHFDAGRPLAAALSFHRLASTGAPARRFEPMLSVRMAACWSRAGMPAAAEETLASVKRRHPRATITIAGKKRALDWRDEESLTWLAATVGPQQHFDPPGAEQWTMHRGSAARNARSPGGRPLLAHRWRVPTVNSGPLIEKVAAQLHQAYVDQHVGALPGFHPLAVKNVILMRTSTNLLAVDFQTGKRIWEVPVDDALAQILPGAATTNTQLSQQLVQQLDRRLWEDTTYGTLSSDGDYVFSVEDLQTPFGQTGASRLVIINGRRVPVSDSAQQYNRLAAHDVRTGKLKWEIGGPTGEYELEQAGAFFLGPPLPLVGHLYVLAEVKGEIRLLVLDAKTAELKWTQQLAVLERNIVQDPFRRYAGISPSYADGVLVCPTAAGTVVAVDLTTRALLWGCRYPRSRETASLHGRGRMMMMRAGIMGRTRGSGNPRWADSSVTIAGGHVLLTPVDSEVLECLNLVDGETLWQKPREDGLYIGCVHDGKVLMVGRAGYRALKLADGTLAWEGDARPYPGSSVPSGRGFFDGRLYYVPLASAGVAAIDVAGGEVVSVSRAKDGGEAERAATVPGNLICYNGSVISQGVDYVECFDQLEALRRRVDDTLRRTPEDPEALARLGEIDLQEGRLAEAVRHLRDSYRLREDPHTRELLFDALLRLLQNDFAAHRQLLPEIEAAVDSPRQRSAYLRLIATGLEEVGDLPAAFDAYLGLIDVADADHGQNGELERLDAVWSVRRDRWVQSRLSGLREAADGRQREAIDGRLHAFLQQALTAESELPLRQFVSHFGAHPDADEARLLLAERLSVKGSLLEAEMLLRQVQDSPQPRWAAAAAARIAMMLSGAGRNHAAAPYAAALSQRWGEVECLDGKTGRQLAAELATAGVTAAPATDDVWPVGRVDDSTKAGNRTTAARRILIEQEGRRGPLDEALNIDVDSQRRKLVARDGFGNERWRYSLLDPRDRSRYPFNPSFIHVRSLGRLFLVSMGQRILALDTLSPSGTGNASVLWKRDLNESIPGLPENRGFNAQVNKVPWAVPRYVPGDAFGRQIGVTGPVTSRVVTYLQNRRLTVVDPISGEVVWTRSDLKPGSRVFGDDDMLFVAGPRDEEATVLRTLDGAELGKRNVPVADERMIHFGSRTVSWSIRDNHAVLEMADVWEKKDLWSYQFDADAKVWLVESEAVGVLQSDGQFKLITLPDGRVLVDQQLHPEPDLAEIYVLKTRDRYTLVANRPRVNRRDFQVHAVPSGYGNPLVNGRIYCFDRHTGASLWEEPAEVQDQALLLRQPSELPVYIFVCQQYEYRDRRRGNGKGKVLCIDKRTGRTIYDGKLTAAISNFEVASNQQNKTVTISTPVSSIELRFTGEEFPEPPPVDENADEQEATGTPAGKAVLRGLRTLAETITGSQRNDNGDRRPRPANEPNNDPPPAEVDLEAPVPGNPLK